MPTRSRTRRLRLACVPLNLCQQSFFLTALYAENAVTFMPAVDMRFSMRLSEHPVKRGFAETMSSVILKLFDVGRVFSPFVEFCVCKARIFRGGDASDVPSKIEMVVRVLQPYVESPLIKSSISCLTLQLLQLLDGFNDVALDYLSIERSFSRHTRCSLSSKGRVYFVRKNQTPEKRSYGETLTSKLSKMPTFQARKMKLLCRGLSPAQSQALQ